MNCGDVGGFIAELRKEQGLTQAELAKMVGVTGGAVSKWERGLCYPEIETVERLAEVFSLSVGEILAGRHIPVYTPETVDALATEGIMEYSERTRKRVSRRAGVLITALALLAAVILVPLLTRQETPEPVSGFERTYYAYDLLCDFDGADIGQFLGWYRLNGEDRQVLASFLVRWEDGKIAAVDRIGCELLGEEPGKKSFQVQPGIVEVKDDSFQFLLMISAQEADKECVTSRDELYTVRFDEHGVPTIEFERYLY